MVAAGSTAPGGSTPADGRRVRVAVAGASGYAGGELLRLLAGHPGVEIVAATAHSKAGTPLGAVHPQLVSIADLELAPTNADVLADADLVFLALPHGESAALAALLPTSVRIVDLGADFRLRDAAAWQRYYGGTARRHLDLRAARAARRADCDRRRRPGRQHRLLRRRHHPRPGPTDRRRHRRARRRGRRRRLRHLGRRPQRQGAPARQRGDGRPVAVQGRRAPARTRDQAGDRREHAVLHADPRADAPGHPGHLHTAPGRPADHPGGRACGAGQGVRRRAVRAPAAGGALAAHGCHLRQQRRPAAGQASTSTPAGSSCSAPSTTSARARPARPCRTPT